MTAVRKVRGTVWHVGRQGEAACGMTQVVNGYLNWNFPRVELGVIRSREGRNDLRALMLFLKAVIAVLRLPRTGGNAVVVHLSQRGSFLREGSLLRLAHARGLGTVAHLHGSQFVEYARRRPETVRRVLRAADRIIALSQATREAVLALLPDARIDLIPNAVPPGAPAPKERLVVFGGSVSRRKGVDVLVEAWRAAGAGTDWRLVIAGPPTEPDLLGNLPAGCEAAGALDHAELMKLLDRSAIAVLPSRDEAMPMFILEAMARRNCVVATRVGGIPAVLGDGHGVLLDPGNVAQLRDALSRLIQDVEYRERIAAAGAARFENDYSAAAIYPRVEAVWLDALGGAA